jgi:two-component system, sensor histidine kinase and response regulator
MTTPASILVIDDEPNNFDVIQAALSTEGYVFHYASSSVRALQRLGEVSKERAVGAGSPEPPWQLNNFQPDVILLDLMMPDLDGIEVCRRIRALPMWRSVPIIVVTAVTDKAKIESSLSAGADDFMTKPIDRLELMAKVKLMVRIKQQNDQLQIARKEFELAAKAKEDLTIEISVINTHLHSISGAIQLLANTAVKPDREHHLKTARLNCEILSTVVNNLLTFCTNTHVIS